MNITRLLSIAAMLGTSVMAITLPACKADRVSGPPVVHLDEDVCHECNMIISDERFATATMIDGPRGVEPRLFDDFNCQVRFEESNPDERIVERWSHDYVSSAWLNTETAVFLKSDDLHTPMASQVAAFASRDEAQKVQGEFGGEILTFAEAWSRLSTRSD